MGARSMCPSGPRHARAVTAVGAMALVAVLLSGCAPASGLADARQFNVPGCTFEVRVGQTADAASVDVRRNGLEPPFVADPLRDCGVHPGVELHFGADGTSRWFCDSYGRSGGTEGVSGACYSYSAGLVGGTWYGGSAPGTLQSAFVVWTDVYDATHRVPVYP